MCGGRVRVQVTILLVCFLVFFFFLSTHLYATEPHNNNKCDDDRHHNNTVGLDRGSFFLSIFWSSLYTAIHSLFFFSIWPFLSCIVFHLPPIYFHKYWCSTKICLLFVLLTFHRRSFTTSKFHSKKFFSLFERLTEKENSVTRTKWNWTLNILHLWTNGICALMTAK